MNRTRVLALLGEFDRDVVRKALSLALAAWASFAVASLLHVHNAYWAAMPVWVLTQPSRGAVLERALFRIVGTLVGAAAGFGLMQLPAPASILLALLAAWLALNTALTHLLRGVHGYGALLAGMTAAVVVVPSLLTPSDTMAIAMSRVECTLIGVVVSSIVLAVLTPVAPLAEFYARVRSVSAAAVAYAAHVLGDRIPIDDGREERRILALISRVDSGARLNAAGSVEGYRRLGDVDRLIVGSLSTMAAAQALRIAGACPDASVSARLGAIARHLHRDFDKPFAPGERAIATAGDAALERLANAVAQILDADDALNAPATPRRGTGAAAPLAPHREWSLAWQAGATAGLCAFAATTLALAIGSPSLMLAALGVCIFVMVLGSQPLPQLIAPKLLIGVIAGVAVASFYRIVVQPGIASTAELLLTIAPFLIVGGFARAFPRTGIAGIDANMCFMLASQAGMPATHDIARILSESGALAFAAAVMAGGFLLLPRRAQRQAVDAAATIRRDLQRIVDDAGATGQADWEPRAARQILRLTLHLGRAAEMAERWPNGLLATLNLGFALTELQRVGMPGSVADALRSMLAGRQTPEQAAASVRALAAAAASNEREAMSRLAATLELAADLLHFELR